MVSKNFHREYFNSKAHGWDTPQDEEIVKKLKNIFQEFHLHPKGNVLDVGCGTGILIPLFSEVKKEQQNLVELDFSEIMLRENKEKWGHCSPTSLSHVHADAHILPFKVESFQWIICFAVLPHLSDKKKSLQECSRVLASQGNLLVLHLMGSRELNCFHSNVGDVITHDQLQPASDLAGVISQCGLEVKTAIDRDDLYLIHAVKN